MDLTVEERYAVASLFTLALHASQWDHNSHECEEPWGEPPAVERDPRLMVRLTEAELDAWWGYDLTAPGGLLDRIYRELQVAPTKVKGLKLLPSAAPSAGSDFFRLMVRDCIAMLDAELAAQLPPLPPRRSSRFGRTADSPVSPQRRTVRDDLFAGLINSDSDDESDDDWAADLEREQKLVASAERTRPPGGLHRHLSQEAEEAVVSITKRLSDGCWSLRSEGSEEEGREQQQGAADEAGVQPLTPPPKQQQQQQQQEKQPQQAAPPPSAAIPSPKAVGAVWELVQCCVGAAPMRPDPSLPKLPRQLAVRWYDARARVALLQVASWLQVPARKVSNLELLLTHGDRAPRTKSLSSQEEDAWERRMRYLKVGAAAVGGGALFAVTGGLAAPAIAAGVGSILGFIGAPVAMAGTVTGFLASTAGAATVTGTMAASGAASTGTRMAYRTAEVSEFGFRELLPAQQQQQQQQRVQGPPPEPVELQAMGSSKVGTPIAAAAAAAAGLADSAAAGAAAGGDPGHLQVLAASSSQSARAQALARRSSCNSMISSGSGSGSSLRGDGSRGQLQLQQQPAPGEQQAAAGEQQTAWQRWFGSSKKEQGEELLLPVPMRAKQSGDVKLALGIFVAGWITQRSDFETTWQGCMDCSDADCFTLVWETTVLLQLNSALGKLLGMQAASQGIQLATHSFFYAGAGLVAALGPTVLLGTASGLFISNAWAVASDRAVKAGKVLAHLLVSGAHGDRPVVLTAHGMGARLVFHCLLELCRLGARGVVQHAVLMGAPVGTEAVRWRMARRAVAGRLVNCFTRKDWLLGVCAGGSSGWMRATAGLVPIEVGGVENVNLSNLVQGHLGYLEEFASIMESLNL
ncbi:hypothetical protein D9Q98_008055 [Chlorella vulgaris]|uniref:Uncharacterized protein n=1 Tax=Chlorella vulgaris TaxID=3077 RepID=A0A9D4TI49_CHLVU|nr:hypothetical protein D9Q98_008055 [Chlorella vulgaris]